MNIRLLALRLATVFALAPALHCAPTISRYMRPVATTRVDRGADTALVVFVRGSSDLGGRTIPIVDEAGNFVADMSASSHTLVRLPAGHHVFTAWINNTDAIDCTLAAGKTYYIDVDVTTGMWGAASLRVHLRTLAPRNPSSRQLAVWIRDTQRLEADPVAATRMATERHDDWMERVRRGREHLARYDGDERELHTVREDDGL